MCFSDFRLMCDEYMPFLIVPSLLKAMWPLHKALEANGPISHQITLP